MLWPAQAHSRALNRGYRVNHQKAKRLLSLEGLYGITSKNKYKFYKETCLVLRKKEMIPKAVDKTNFRKDFATTSCNEKWATNASEFHIASGKLFLSPIIDMHKDEIICFDISQELNFKQTVTMLKVAFEMHQKLDILILCSY